jgi:hypothetical protein
MPHHQHHVAARASSHRASGVQDQRDILAAMKCSRSVSMMVALGAALAAGSAATGCKKKEDKPAAAAEPTPPPPPAIADAAPPPPVDAAPPAGDAAKTATAPTADPLKSICPQVMAKIVECSADKEFEKALKEGITVPQQKLATRLIASIAEWPTTPCSALAATYQYEGFLDRWDELKDPAILESCAKLGAAVRDAGGLFGGDSDL